MKKTLLFGICAILLFTGCSIGNKKSNTSNKKNNIIVKINNNQEVGVSYVITADKNVIITAKNNSSKKMDYVSIDMAIYGSDGNLKSVEKQYLHNLDVNQENIVKATLGNGTTTNADIDKVEIAVNVTNYDTPVENSYYTNVTASVAPTDTDGQLLLTLANNSGQILDEVNVAIVFYKNGQIVDLYNSIAQQVADTYTDTAYIPVSIKEDGTMSFVEYDDVKVVVNNATKYNS